MTASPPPLRLRVARALACATICAAVCAAPALPPALGAQEPPPRSVTSAIGDTALLASLATLRPRARVLADTGGLRLVAGRYQEHDADTLWLLPDAGRADAVPLERIRALHVRRGTWANQLGATGAVLLALIRYHRVAYQCVLSSGDAGMGCRAQGVFVSAAVGAALGAAIGSTIPRWTRTYPAPSQSPPWR